MTGRPGICGLLGNPYFNHHLSRLVDRPVPQLMATGLGHTFPLFVTFYSSIYNSYIDQFGAGIAQSV
jgi:hypothetical protein